MASPAVSIDVDEQSGIWRTDGLPMVYLPRHFLVNNHLAVEEALGIQAYRGILHTATRKSAIHWCESAARTHGLEREAAFHLYFERLSQRGWGLFSVDRLDLEGNRGGLSLRNSVFALECGANANRRVCYMFEGFVTGAFHFLLGPEAGSKRIKCEEAQCVAEGQHACCRFEFSARQRVDRAIRRADRCAIKPVAVERLSDR
jgi:hypothetical protein